MHYDCLLRSSNHDSQGKCWRSIIELSLSPVHCISWTSYLSFCIFLAMTLLQMVPLKKTWLACLLVTFFKVWMFCCYRLGFLVTFFKVWMFCCYRLGRGWDGWMASLTQCTWVWVNSGRWCRTGKPGVLQSMGLKRVGHDRVTKQQQQIGNWK